MTTDELKKLAEAAKLTGYQLLEMSINDMAEAQRLKQQFRQIRPEVILKLLDINAGLVEALKGCMTGCEFRSIGGDSPTWHQKQMPSNEALDKARAALAKAEGGEL